MGPFPFPRRWLRSGPEAPASDQAQLVPERLALLQAAAVDCIRLVPTSTAGGSWLGGTPTLVSGQAWPRRDGVPLAFLAEFDLADLRAAGGPDWLAGTGALQFFYDEAGFATGGSAEERDGWCVRWIDRSPSQPSASFPDDLPRECRHARFDVGFARARSLPDLRRVPSVTEGLSRQAREALETARIEQLPRPKHQIGGAPDSIQEDDMERQAAVLATGGSWPLKGRARRDAETMDVSDWRLLLQLDTDPEMGTQWGDEGTLYFWISAEQARKGDFSDVWMILQCY